MVGAWVPDEDKGLWGDNRGHYMKERNLLQNSLLWLALSYLINRFSFFF